MDKLISFPHAFNGVIFKTCTTGSGTTELLCFKSLPKITLDLSHDDQLLLRGMDLARLPPALSLSLIKEIEDRA